LVWVPGSRWRSRSSRPCVTSGSVPRRTARRRAAYEDGTGQPEGLWQFLPPRVFGSTSGKPTTSSGALKSVSKIVPTEHGGKPTAPKPNAQVWNPQFIEVFVAGMQTGDRPEDWAALTHELADPLPGGKHLDPRAGSVAVPVVPRADQLDVLVSERAGNTKPAPATTAAAATTHRDHEPPLQN
jgi:hypothetical protein